MSTITLSVLLTLVAATAGENAGNTHLGCNAGGFAMGRNVFFADLVKQSIFTSVLDPTVQNVTVDSAGWPTTDFALLAYNEPGGYTYPVADLSGVYTVTAAGCAAVSIPTGYPGATVLNASCSGGSLLAYIQVSSDGALVAGRLALLFTNTSRSSGGGGGLVNVSMLQPGFPIGTDPETMTAAAIAQFRRCSLIRFLGWTLVGHTQWDDQTPPTTANWSQRALVGQPSYVIGGWGILGNGAPWETAAALCNAVGADMWVNVPSSADEAMRDDYITRLVTLLDGTLGPGQRLFVEFGNECFFGEMREMRLFRAKGSRCITNPSLATVLWTLSYSMHRSIDLSCLQATTSATRTTSRSPTTRSSTALTPTASISASRRRPTRLTSPHGARACTRGRACASPRSQGRSWGRRASGAQTCLASASCR
jgi:hypothetical protein